MDHLTISQITKLSNYLPIVKGHDGYKAQRNPPYEAQDSKQTQIKLHMNDAKSWKEEYYGTSTNVQRKCENCKMFAKNSPSFDDKLGKGIYSDGARSDVYSKCPQL